MSEGGMGRPATERNAIKQYFLDHPEAKDSEVCIALNASKTTVARARWDLIDEGLLPAASRRRRPGPQKETAAAPPKAPKPPARDPNEMLSGEELAELAADLDGMDNLDDEAVRSKMLKSLRRLAFSTSVNNDTKLTAMNLWFKLKDLASIKALGPGNPLTFEAALGRLTELATACGMDLVLRAAVASFGLPAILTALSAMIGVPDEGKAPADPVEADSGLPRTPEAPGGDPDLPAHDGPAGPL